MDVSDSKFRLLLPEHREIGQVLQRVAEPINGKLPWLLPLDLIPNDHVRQQDAP